VTIALSDHPDFAAALTLDTNVVDATVCAGGAAPGSGLCPAGSVAPTITTLLDQSIPVSGSTTVGFTVSGSIIPSGLILTATSSDPVLVPQSALVFGPAGVTGARTLTVTGADGRSGTTTP